MTFRHPIARAFRWLSPSAAVCRQLVTVLLAMTVGAGSALAQSSAGSVVRLVVPAPPGGAMDRTARMLAPGMAKQLGQMVVVDNRPGAQAIVGTEAVVRAMPDGHTLLVVASSLATNPMLHKLSYDALTELAPVAGILRERFVLVVRKGMAVDTLDDLLAMLRADGPRLSCGASPGVMQLGCEQLRLQTSAQSVTVPFNGGAALANAVVAGHVDMAFLPLDSAMRQIEGRRVVPVAMGDAQRAALPLPALPLLSERLPGLTVLGFNGLMAPARTPPERIDQLARAVQAAQDEPDFRAYAALLGNPVLRMGPLEFGEFTRAETARLGRIIEYAGIKAP